MNNPADRRSVNLYHSGKFYQRLTKILLITIFIIVIFGSIFLQTGSANPEISGNAPFPRIANCYNAGLPWVSDEQINSYLSKLDLIIGVGGYDFHNDWQDPWFLKNYDRVCEAIAKLKRIKPAILVLPYVDVIEGPFNNDLPANFWMLDNQGKKVSTWPGFYRVKTDQKSVLEYSYRKVKELILKKTDFDGVFYDCWQPDKVLTGKTVNDFPKTIVMTNAGNLPEIGCETVNGVLSEDELNRVLEGKMEYDIFLKRYIQWTKNSRAPHVTTIVCHPRTMNDDPWRWANLSDEKRQAEMDAARDSDNQVMRLGLASSMMGDGYFAYDAGTMARGNWWWYPEYDAKVGQPLSFAQEFPDGTWRREFEGGTVIANGTIYDTKIHFDRLMEDVSTQRVARDFVLPMQDGRIYRPSEGTETAVPDIPITFSTAPPEKLLSATLANGDLRFQLPSGLEAIIESSGMVNSIYYKGKRIVLGGKTVIVNPPWKEFKAVETHYSVDTDDCGINSVVVNGTGSLTEGDSRLGYTTRITLGPGPVVLINLQYVAESDLKLQMWRHYFSFPVSIYKGASAWQGNSSAKLPGTFYTEEILKWSKDPLVIVNNGMRISAVSSLGMSLADLRKYGEPEFLWAGYPDHLQFNKGSTWEVQLKLQISEKPAK